MGQTTLDAGTITLADGSKITLREYLERQEKQEVEENLTGEVKQKTSSASIVMRAKRRRKKHWQHPAEEFGVVQTRVYNPIEIKLENLKRRNEMTLTAEEKNTMSYKVFAELFKHPGEPIGLARIAKEIGGNKGSISAVLSSQMHFLASEELGRIVKARGRNAFILTAVMKDESPDVWAERWYINWRASRITEKAKEPAPTTVQQPPTPTLSTKLILEIDPLNRQATLKGSVTDILRLMENVTNGG